MNDVARCPSCQCEVPPDAPAGLCLKCLVAAGFHSGPPPTGPNPGASGFAAPSPAELAPHFPDLEILELIGRGGMGAIYKARQPGLDRVVALKILPPEVGRDPAFADRFMREAKALARLNHPNIVTLFDVGVSKNGICRLVMEYVDGINLRQMMRDGGVTPIQALAIIPQICDALQYAHEQGIVHRDIKPENLLLDRKGRVKIADFGLSKLLGHDSPEPLLTQTHQVMGTLRYMAPEQMQGTKSVDHRADIYSLGVVFYELLTGEVPMGRFEPPSQRVQVDVRLDEVVLRSLEREPMKRYQHASDVKTDVETISATPLHSAASVLRAPADKAPAARSGSDPTRKKGLSPGCLVAAVLGFFVLFALVIPLLLAGAAGVYWLVPMDAPQANIVNEGATLGPDGALEQSVAPKPDSGPGTSSERTSPLAARPSAQRVARRAQVLALVNYRASLEEFAGQEKYEALHAKLPQWIDKLDLAGELEPAEFDLLRAPLGKAEEGLIVDATWRDEGLGVLAWALTRSELPPYDQAVKAALVGESIGFSETRLAALDVSMAEELIQNAQLRSVEEIDRYAVHATLLTWRLRIHPLPEESASEGKDRMNFAGYLREHPSFHESWLNGLRLKDKDLVIGGLAVHEAKSADVERYALIAVERQTAAYWLRGDAPIYSHVDPTTILSGLGESVKETTMNPQNVRLERIGHLAGDRDDPFLSLAVQGNYAYLIQGNVETPKRLQVVDLADPTQPKFVGSCPVNVEAMRLAVAGDHVYVLDDPLLRVFDVSKPSEPREVGSCELGEHLWDVAVQGTFAYVTDVASVRVVDVKDAAMPREIGRCEVSEAQGITVSGSHAYVACDIEGMRVVDVSKPETPKAVGVFSEPAGAANVTIAGRYAFIAGGEDAVTLWIADISDPARPTRVCKYGDWIAGSIAVQDDLAFLAGGDVDILDISNLANLATPRRIGGYGAASFITNFGDKLLTLSDAGLSVLRIVREK